VDFWTGPVLRTAMILLLLLGAGELLRRGVPGLKGLGIPSCILAGVLGLALGPSAAGLLPFDVSVLESLVYHALAVVFIAVGLQPAEAVAGPVGPGVRSFTFGIPLMQSLQIALGLGLVLLIGAVGVAAPHPGLGALLALGFEQGPGQALAMGAAWEELGLRDGADIGLIMAAMGYGWSIVVGLPLVLWGRKRGLIQPAAPRGVEPRSSETEDASPAGAGALDPFTTQLVLIAGCYLITWLLCRGLFALLGMVEVWGFHFIVGTGVAMAVRPLLARLPGGGPVDGRAMGRISGVTVDLMTTASLAAVQLAVLDANLLPVLLITSLGGLLTLIACLWLASRAFPEAPFEHAVVWFGMSTGTLAMGLALLRIIDPGMRSPAPLGAVLGSAGAAAFSVPTLLLLLPAVMRGWHAGYTWAPAAGVLAALVYAGVLLGLWRVFGALRFRGPPGRLWWRAGA